MTARILLVEDDTEIRMLLRELLESEGYEVETATDGVAAWDKLVHQPERYQAILLDLTLPHMTGLQLIQALQQQYVATLRSVIVLSADTIALQQVLAMGVGHVLTRPFDLDTILALIASVTAPFLAGSNHAHEHE
ncbi:MAG TPA: response regulator [Ktedonobacteraceae bacterium]